MGKDPLHCSYNATVIKFNVKLCNNYLFIGGHGGMGGGSAHLAAEEVNQYGQLGTGTLAKSLPGLPDRVV